MKAILTAAVIIACLSFSVVHAQSEAWEPVWICHLRDDGGYDQLQVDLDQPNGHYELRDGVPTWLHPGDYELVGGFQPCPIGIATPTPTATPQPALEPTVPTGTPQAPTTTPTRVAPRIVFLVPTPSDNAPAALPRTGANQASPAGALLPIVGGLLAVSGLGLMAFTRRQS